MASPRRQPEPFRTGRIKAESSTGSIVLPIVSRPGAFRIFNSGKNAFHVRRDSEGDDQRTLVPSKSSLDVEVTAGIKIEYSNGTGKVSVEGIYEVLGARTIRGGRFRGDAPDVADAITAVKGAPRPYYRILNSGRRNFTVQVSGTDVVILRPRHSIDVLAGTGISVYGDNDIEGIYDYLDGDNVVRSGRFKGNASMRIIDLSDATVSAGTAYYRIWNSGEEDFQFQAGGTSVALHPDQSFDFKIDLASAAADKRVVVAPVTTGKRIQGMYEFQGAQ